MNRREAAELLDRADLPIAVRRVGEEIARAWGYVRVTTIAERTGLKPDEVRRAFKTLAARGFIDVRPSLLRDSTGARIITTGTA